MRILIGSESSRTINSNIIVYPCMRACYVYKIIDIEICEYYTCINLDTYFVGKFRSLSLTVLEGE